MLTNFKSPECTLCGKTIVGVIHMGCDAVHCSERCARQYLIAVRKKDPNMENPGCWPGGSASGTMKRKPSLSCITEDALSEAETTVGSKTWSPDEETMGKNKQPPGPIVRLSEAGAAVAGALLIMLVVACLGLI